MAKIRSQKRSKGKKYRNISFALSTRAVRSGQGRNIDTATRSLSRLGKINESRCFIRYMNNSRSTSGSRLLIDSAASGTVADAKVGLD